MISKLHRRMACRDAYYQQSLPTPETVHVAARPVMSSMRVEPRQDLSPVTVAVRQPVYYYVCKAPHLPAKPLSTLFAFFCLEWRGRIYVVRCDVRSTMYTCLLWRLIMNLADLSTLLDRPRLYICSSTPYTYYVLHALYVSLVHVPRAGCSKKNHGA